MDGKKRSGSCICIHRGKKQCKEAEGGTRKIGVRKGEKKTI